MHVCVQGLLTGVSTTYKTVRYLCSWSASQPATFSFPIFVNACRPKCRVTVAWLRYVAVVPILSSAEWSFFAKSSTGILRVVGRMAIVFKLRLFQPSSVPGQEAKRGIHMMFDWSFCGDRIEKNKKFLTTSEYGGPVDYRTGRRG